MKFNQNIINILQNHKINPQTSSSAIPKIRKSNQSLDSFEWEATAALGSFEWEATAALGSFAKELSPAGD